MVQSMCVDFISERVGESPRVKSRGPQNKTKLINQFTELNSSFRDELENSKYVYV